MELDTYKQFVNDLDHAPAWFVQLVEHGYTPAQVIEAVRLWLED
jgi:hypothetical protein